MIALLILLGCVAVIVGGAVVVRQGWGQRVRAFTVEGERFGLLLLGWTIVGVGSITLITVISVWPSLYFTSLGDVKNLEAFSEENLPAYLWTIEKAEGLTITASEPGLIDIAYQEQSKTATQAVVDLRDKVSWYNSKLRSLHALKSTPFGVFMYDIPDDLQPILIREHIE